MLLPLPLLCVLFLLLFLFCFVDTVCGLTTEYLDLIDYDYTVAAAQRTSMYLYIPATYFCCCSVMCCYTAVAAAAAACCCYSSSCAGWQNLLLWSTASVSSVFFLFIQTRLLSMYPLAVLPHLQRRFFTYNTYHVYILGNYGHARSQGGR